MQLDPQICSRARRSRDTRFDGQFFTGVLTTRIYCRPVCPARVAKEENVRYFPSAAAAAAAGLRPCLRCRPETAPGTPAWSGTSASVSRGLRLVNEAALENFSVDDIAQRAGLGSRQLRRLFVRHLGATPTEVLQTRRLHFAKQLIDETTLSFTEVALAAGFGSVRRFNAVVRALYGRAPSDLRKLARTSRPSVPEAYTFRLRYRNPFDWCGLLSFFRPRAIPGVETVGTDFYRRTIPGAGRPGFMEARCHRSWVELTVSTEEPAKLCRIVQRVRRMFDLDADPVKIDEQLQRQPVVGSLVRRRPGRRVPGCWDPFELTVRAILGQQITVQGATTLAGRLVARFGVTSGSSALFPTPDALAEADVSSVGLPRARADTIRRVAALVARKDLRLDPGCDPERSMAQLREVPGIGEWTVQYIAMRALSDPDAFPASDLVLIRASGCNSAAELLARSEAWRPWRAYAAVHLWQARS